MKKVLGMILLFLGAFLLTAAIFLATLGPGLTQRTPKNVDTDTYLTGTASKLDAATGELNSDLPVKVFSNTKVDPKKSDGKVVVFVNYSCVNIDKDDPPNCLKGDDDRVVTNSLDTFAEDRHTGIAVNGTKYIGKDATPHEGLINKFPFDTQKKTYQYWDSLLGKTVPATYESTLRLQGLEVYKFSIDVPSTTTQIADGLEGTYQSETTVWVEPKTGAIVDQKQHQVRKLADGSTALDLSLAFTPKTVKDGIADAKSNKRLLTTVSTTGPIVAGILGVLALVAGGLLLLGRRESY